MLTLKYRLSTTLVTEMVIMPVPKFSMVHVIGVHTPGSLLQLTVWREERRGRGEGGESTRREKMRKQEDWRLPHKYSQNGTLYKLWHLGNFGSVYVEKGGSSLPTLRAKFYSVFYLVHFSTSVFYVISVCTSVFYLVPLTGSISCLFPSGNSSSSLTPSLVTSLHNLFIIPGWGLIRVGVANMSRDS